MLRVILLAVACALTAPPVAAQTPHQIPPLPPSAAAPVKHPSGLTTIDIREGKGVEVGKGRIVRILYSGWLKKNGYMFDYRDKRNDPLVFRIGASEVIPGWNQGVVGMRVGGKRRIIVPAALAYGGKGTRRIPPNSDLVFDIELIGAAREGA